MFKKIPGLGIFCTQSVNEGLRMPEVRMMLKTCVGIQQNSRQGEWVSCDIKNGSVWKCWYLQFKTTGTSVLQSNYPLHNKHNSYHTMLSLHSTYKHNLLIMPVISTAKHTIMSFSKINCSVLSIICYCGRKGVAWIIENTNNPKYILY
jgi:hypothetical protein